MRPTVSKLLLDGLLMLLVFCWSSQSKPAPLRGAIDGCIEEAFRDAELVCLRCVQSRFASLDRQECHRCPLDCTACADYSGACTSCRQGLVLKGGQCVSPFSKRLLADLITCSPGFFLIEGECRTCSSNCRTCESFNVCKKCFLAYSRATESNTQTNRVVCEFQWFLAMMIIILVVVALTACFAIIRIFFLSRDTHPQDEYEYEASRDTIVGGSLQVENDAIGKSDNSGQRP